MAKITEINVIVRFNVKDALVKLVSRKLAALIWGGAVMITMKLLGSDPQVMGALGMGFAAALTAVIGGQAMIDHAEAKKQ